MRIVLSNTMIKLLTLLLVFLPVLLAVQVHDSHPHHASRMIHQRRSFMSWLTRISSKTSDWMFGSVPIPTVDKSQIPHPAVGGVSVLPKMPYPYATGMIPRLASETLSGNGLPGGWMCLHVTPPADAHEGAGDRQRGAAGGDQGGMTGAAGQGAAGQGAAGSGTAGGQSGGAGGGGSAGAGVGVGGMAGGMGAGGSYGEAGGAGGGFAGGQQQMGGTGFQGGNGGGSFYPSGQQGFGTSNGYMGGAAGAGIGGGNDMGSSGMGNSGMGSSGMGGGGIGGNGMGSNGMVGNGMGGNGMGGNGLGRNGMGGNGMGGNGMGGNGVGGNGMGSAGMGGYPMGSNGIAGGYPQIGGMSNGFGAGPGAGMGSDGTGAGSGGGMSGYPGSSGAAFGNRGSAVPSGYIRYNGQLMTIDQYQQALAGGGPSGPSSNSQSLSRRELQPDSSSFFVHKRQADPSDGAPQPSSDGDSPPARKGKTAIAKVLMCINGDPAVPPIKFNTMTGMRLRDASVPKDGVVDITNLPNYKMPWMPFLPTAEMWAEQQELMLAQEQMIETNMTTTPPPSR